MLDGERFRRTRPANKLMICARYAEVGKQSLKTVTSKACTSVFLNILYDTRGVLMPRLYRSTALQPFATRIAQTVGISF